MIEPKQAPVKPRVFSPHTGEIIALEDEIRDLLESNSLGQVWIFGPPGAGKTTTLQHLAAVLSSSLSKLNFVDSPCRDTARKLDVLTICTATTVGHGISRAYRLAPWTTDCLIEYLLFKHKEKCASVMNRLKTAPDCGLVMGNPELWATIIDQMACDESILDVRLALLDFIDSKFPNLNTRKLMQSHSLSLLLGAESLAAQSFAAIKKSDMGEETLRLIRHRLIQILLAAEQITTDLANNSQHLQLAMQLPRDLVQEVANQIQSDSKSIETLKRVMSGSKTEFHPMTASILHLVDPSWIPAPFSLRALAGCYLDHVNWPRVDLEKANLRQTDLSFANLEYANFYQVDANQTNFRSASLRGANMRGIAAIGSIMAHADLSCTVAEQAQIYSADLQGANLEGALFTKASFHGSNLQGARVAGADLRQANLRGANIENSDFSAANLGGACLAGLKLAHATFFGAVLTKADLTKCDLEYMDLPAANFQGANLEGALLTGSSMSNADFSKARLRHTGLADIDWEGANLRAADLTGATFHMGSSRSGLVGSPIASEGTRTGFYTDDYTEQDFKAPEEIRKANLCGADLRGANIDGVDFYLVDLRNALYDPDQEQHFRRCGAILESRPEA